MTSCCSTSPPPAPPTSPGRGSTPEVARAYRRYRHGPGAFKVDFAVEGGVPWTAEACRSAGTVHVVGTFDETVGAEAEVNAGRMPERPYVLVGQQYLADPSRSAGDVHPVWAYAHVPNGWERDETETFIGQIERFAPGFRERIVAQVSKGPAEFEAYNSNFIGGDIIGGANSPRQIVSRPRLGLKPYSTGIPGVFMCSASTPPGAGVHGMNGSNAAKRGAGRTRASVGGVAPPNQDSAPPPRPATEAQTGFERQGMVPWLSPKFLIGAGLEVVHLRAASRSSSTSASWQPACPATARTSSPAKDEPAAPPYTDASYRDEDGALWLDYAADVGEGFDPTYTVAWLLAREDAGARAGRRMVDQARPGARPGRRSGLSQRELGGLPRPVRRPVPCRASASARRDEVPHMFAIPGNHDWYDGLTSFMRLFSQRSWIGAWRTRQRRSYFALRLSERWWLWATDIQFDTYLDGPQLEYFRKASAELEDGPPRDPRDGEAELGRLRATGEPGAEEGGRVGDALVRRGEADRRERGRAGGDALRRPPSLRALRAQERSRARCTGSPPAAAAPTRWEPRACQGQAEAAVARRPRRRLDVLPRGDLADARGIRRDARRGSVEARSCG